MALSTSGTTTSVSIDTRTLVDRIYGVLRLRPQQITGEMQSICLSAVQLVQNDLLNYALPLWTLEKILIACVEGQQQYTLPQATNDINRAFYRNSWSDVTASATATSAPLSYQLDFGAGVTTQCSSCQINWGTTQQVAVTFQTSPDGVTWTTVGTGSTVVVVNSQGVVNYDVDNSAAARFFQIIPTDGVSSLSGVTANVYNTPVDILMYRMNKDDYWNLTNKTAQGRPLQFWLDRQLTPVMNVWQVPNAGAALNTMVVWRQRQIQDVGGDNALQLQLEFPGRWFLPFIYLCAAEVGYLTPDVDPNWVTQVAAKAENMHKRAWLEERDKSPIRFNANIQAYTK